MFGLGASSLKGVLCMLLVLLMSVPMVTASSDSEATSDPVVVILFMFFGLAMGIIIMQALSAMGEPVPYTCVVFATGIIFSLGTKGDGGGIFTESINDWVNIDADLLLFAFLPPLIFGEAMNLNFYHVRGGFLQAVILAGPGVLIGAALVGVITKYMLPYDWSWNLAMCFGSILSATDPVAVVSLLKSAGASPKLTILIVGESLLNDGTAMVLFTIFYESLNGRQYTASSITAFFAAACLGSVFLGLGCGVLIIRWLRTANRPLKEIDTTIQIAITITSAYLIFFLAQYVLKISGVLACCGAGIMLAWLAPPIILSHETMHNVWGMIEWVLNTLIFLLAGLIIGNRVIDKVAIADWFYVVVLYIVLMGGRLLTIGMLFPFISTIGHKCSRNEAIFMSWAGLRGALSMALALLVERNCPDDLHDETSRLFFYVGGIAALTMIINATTANSVLVYLGLLGNDSAEKNLVMQQIKKRLKRRMDAVLTEMATEFAFTPQDLDEVRDSCSLYADTNLDSLYRDSERMSMQSVVYGASANNSHLPSEVMDSRNSKHGRMSLMNKTAASSAVASAASPSLSPMHIGEASLESGHAKMPPAVSIAKANVPALTDKRPSFSASLGQASQDGYGDYDDEESGQVHAKSPANAIFTEDSRLPSSLRTSNYTPPTPQGTEDDEDILNLNAELDRVRQERETRHNRRSSTRSFSQGGRSSHNTDAVRSKSVSLMKATDLVRMLSMSSRGPGAFLIPQLLTYVRAIFLEILRVRYWHDIERGKLPRNSHSAKYLLYSVEVGVDEVDQELGARDWNCINREIVEQPLSIRMLSYIDTYLPHTYGTYYLGKLEARREKRAVYMLNSFIDAHEHAQKKVHEFIASEEEDGEEDVKIQSPEELKVIDESKQAVEAARRLLDAMNGDTVLKIRAKQAAALVLTKQAELIKNMVGEGLLTPQHAEEFLMEISDDLQRMEKDRNKMYWEQGEKLAKKRQELRKVETESTGRRSSLFSVFDWQKKPVSTLTGPIIRTKEEV